MPNMYIHVYVVDVYGGNVGRAVRPWISHPTYVYVDVVVVCV